MYNTCKYCGHKLHKNEQSTGMCHNCRQKLPLVRKLVRIGQQIKKECRKIGDTE